MAKKKAKTPITKGNLVATFLFWNPDTAWTKAKPTIQKLFEGQCFTFDDTEAKRLFDNQKAAMEAARTLKKLAEQLKPLLPEAEAILAQAKAEKAAKKKKP